MGYVAFFIAGVMVGSVGAGLIAVWLLSHIDADTAPSEDVESCP